ncbi:MAG: aldose 1-epimerase family protein [Clostridia bacterium]|nr:aldose 1-epimerase family protein [Clostridia bacterium]
MSKIITIKNEFLTVAISTAGAEIQSIRSNDGTEYIWQGDPKFWNKHAPILFPICGGLVDDTYTLDGKAYTLEKHGFARNKEFIEVCSGESYAELMITDGEDTYGSYPFNFEFRASFKLDKKTLWVDFTVVNLSQKTMYYSCGSHEGYNLPSGIDGAKLIFECPEILKDYEVEGGILGSRYSVIGDGSDTLVLDRKYFEIDAIILKELSSRSLTLCDIGGERKIRVDFPDFDRLLIWQACGAPFVCIEPWTGLPDPYGSTDRAIKNKLSISSLDAGTTRTHTHGITIL